MASIKTIFKNIANAIRIKKGTSDKYFPENMASEVLSIETGIDTSDGTATENDILLDKTAYVNGEKLTGTIPTYNNEHEGGVVVEDRLKKFLDTTKSAKYLLASTSSISYEGLFEADDFENVTNFSYMFTNVCRNEIPLINTKSATTMEGMFKLASIENIPLLDTSNVINMSYMFASEFNNIWRGCANIPLLDTSKVTDMSYMFSWNHNLTTLPQLDTSNVTNMYGMFEYCRYLTTLPQLNTSKVIRMANMFVECRRLQTIPPLDTSSATDLYCTFKDCYLLQTIDITHMKTADTNKSYGTYSGCYSLKKLIIRNMDTLPIISTYTFQNCYHFLGTTNETYNPEGLKDGRIYVPDDKVEELKLATNWSALADIIVGLSELEE